MSVPMNRSSMPANVWLMTEIALVGRRWRSLMDDELRALGVTQARWVILWWIAEARTALSQTDLARKLGIENSTLVRQLDALEERGLVERVVDSDRRVRLIKLTPAGMPVVKRIKQIADELSSDLLAGVDAATIEACGELLHEMRERLRAGRGEAADAAAEPVRPRRARGAGAG